MKPLHIELADKKIVLIPACCIHYPLGDKTLLKEWIDKLKKTKGAYAFLIGDNFDAERTHFRDHLRSYRSDETSIEVFDAFMQRDVDGLAKILKPVSKKILGVVRGNHYHQFADGTNSDQRLCRAIGVPYLGALSLVRLATPSGEITVYIHHTAGSGGSRTIGGDAGGLQRQETGWMADVFLAGHTHRKFAWKECKLGMTRGPKPEPVQHTVVFARCGTFLQGYKMDYPNNDQVHAPAYAELRSYRPTDLGWVEIKVSWKADGRPDFEIVT